MLASRRRLIPPMLAATAATAMAGAPALAQDSPTPQTITVLGQSRVKPRPEARTNASITKAVTAARASAVPLAISDGAARATALAQAGGLVLGDLENVSEGTGGPFGFYGPYGQDGTLGPGKFCGTIRRYRSVKGKDGKRHRKVTTRKGCIVPTYVNEVVTMTYKVSKAQ